MAKSNKNNSVGDGSIIGGIVLVLLGLTFLVQSYLHIDILDKAWPLILVVVGVLVIFNATRRR